MSDCLAVDVWLYGPLVRYGSSSHGKSYANLKLSLPAGSRLRSLLDHLGLPTEQRGITFINGNLSAVPGMQPDLDHVLKDGDRVAFFHLKSMWPYQYRHGAGLAPELADRISKSVFHGKAGQDNDPSTG